MAGVLRKNIWFSLPVTKIKFDPPPHGKNTLNGWVGGVVDVIGWWCVGGWVGWWCVWGGRVGGVRVGVGVAGGLVLVAEGSPHYCLGEF